MMSYKDSSNADSKAKLDKETKIEIFKSLALDYKKINIAKI